MKHTKVAFVAILTVLVILASAVVVAFAIISAGEGENPGTTLSLYNIAAGIAYALLLAAFVMVVAFPVLRIVSSYKTYVKTLAGAIFVAGIFLLSYVLSPEFSGGFYAEHEVGSRAARLVNASLITTYLALLVTVVAFIYGEISSRLK